MTDSPRRRWYQFSLRALFVLLTLVAVCEWGWPYAYHAYRVFWPEPVPVLHLTDSEWKAALKELQVRGTIHQQEETRKRLGLPPFRSVPGRSLPVERVP